jgi:hypothetical protein
MTESELKRMLQNYNRIRDRLKCYQERLNDIDALVSVTKDLKAVAYTGMPGNPSNISDPTYQSVEQVLCKYKEEADDLKVKIQKLQEQQWEVNYMLAQLKDADRLLIVLRHIDGCRWVRVAQEMRECGKPCSLRQLYRREKRSIMVMLKVQ